MDTNQRLMIATQSTLITLSESKVNKDDEKHVLLKLQRSGKQAENFYYWIGRNTPLSSLMVDYTRRIDVPLNSVRFVFDDSPIKPSYSANRLKLDDGDSIDVIQRAKYEGTLGTLICLPRAKGEIPMIMEVAAFVDNPPLRYLVGRNTRLENLFLDYADRTSRFYDNIRFVTIRDGQQRGLDPKKTADDLKMEDGDVIIVETKTISMYSGSTLMGMLLQKVKQLRDTLGWLKCWSLVPGWFGKATSVEKPIAFRCFSRRRVHGLIKSTA